jgi:hypothetical protein
MDDYKLVYGLMDRLKKTVDTNTIIDQFNQLTEQLPESDQKQDWRLAVMHWDQTNSLRY